MVTFLSAEDMAGRFDFIPKGKKDKERLQAAWELYLEKKENCGVYGMIAEILTARPRQTKKTVAGPHEVDNKASFIVNGKKRLVDCERKTNGGRIDNILNCEYIIYTLDVHNKYTNLTIPAKIIKSSVFMDTVKALGAYHEVKNNTSGDGHNVQVSNKAFQAWLAEQLDYNREWSYYPEDFEG